MSREKEVWLAKEWYQKGYREGFTDACDLVEHSLPDLKASMEEGLNSHTVAVDEEAHE